MANFQIGKSEAMKKIHRTVKRICNSDLPILIEGETGTGKTLLAREIHKLSSRGGKLFVNLDCATVSSGLVESELFGHEKGAFTGATEAKMGLLELACGGTLFLDEIENLEPPIQAKLLRVLEEKKFRRVGGRQEKFVDFRLISASNVSIKERMREGSFREDLYYRLRGTSLHLPPLRQRKEDIPQLAELFLEFFNRSNKTRKRLANGVPAFLVNYAWPGNVRELKLAIEEAAIKAEGDELQAEDFSLELNCEFMLTDGKKRHLSLAEMEKRYIELILSSADFNKAQAAQILDIGVNTLYRKMQKYGITGRGQ